MAAITRLYTRQSALSRQHSVAWRGLTGLLAPDRVAAGGCRRL